MMTLCSLKCKWILCEVGNSRNWGMSVRRTTFTFFTLCLWRRTACFIHLFIVLKLDVLTAKKFCTCYTFSFVWDLSLLWFDNPVEDSSTLGCKLRQDSLEDENLVILNTLLCL